MFVDDDEYELYALNNPDDIKRSIGRKKTLELANRLIGEYGGVVFIHNLVTDTFYYKG